MSISRNDLIHLNDSCDKPEYTHVCMYQSINNIINNHKINTCPCYNMENKMECNKFIINSNKKIDYARKYNYTITKPCPDCYKLQFEKPLLNNDKSCPNILNFADYSTFNSQIALQSMSKIDNVKTNPNLFNDMSTLSYSQYK